VEVADTMKVEFRSSELSETAQYRDMAAMEV